MAEALAWHQTGRLPSFPVERGVKSRQQHHLRRGGPFEGKHLAAPMLAAIASFAFVGAAVAAVVNGDVR